MAGVGVREDGNRRKLGDDGKMVAAHPPVEPVKTAWYNQYSFQGEFIGERKLDPSGCQRFSAGTPSVVNRIDCPYSKLRPERPVCYLTVRSTAEKSGSFLRRVLVRRTDIASQNV